MSGFYENKIINHMRDTAKSASIGQFQNLASAGWTGVLPVGGVTPPFNLTIEDAITNTTTTFINFTHTSTGTVANNFGIRNLWLLEDSANNAAEEAFSMDIIWSNATSGSEEADVVFRHKVTGAALAEKFRFQSDSRLYIQSSDAVTGYAGVRCYTPNREYYMGLSTGNANFQIYDNTAGIARLWIKDTGEVLIGNTAAAAADSILHVHLATAGTVTAPTGTILTVENSSNSLVTILSPNSSYAGFVFGRPSDNDAGYILYDHAFGNFQFNAESVSQLIWTNAVSSTFQFQKNTTISSTGQLTLSSHIFIMNEIAAPAVSASGTGKIYFDSTAKVFKVSENAGDYVDLSNWVNGLILGLAG